MTVTASGDVIKAETVNWRLVIAGVRIDGEGAVQDVTLRRPSRPTTMCPAEIPKNR